MNIKQRTANLIATSIIYKLQNTGTHWLRELFCIYYLFMYTLNGILFFPGIYTVGFLVHYHRRRRRRSYSLLCSIYLIWYVIFA